MGGCDLILRCRCPSENGFEVEQEMTSNLKHDVKTRSNCGSPGPVHRHHSQSSRHDNGGCNCWIHSILGHYYWLQLLSLWLDSYWHLHFELSPRLVDAYPDSMYHGKCSHSHFGRYRHSCYPLALLQLMTCLYYF